MLINTKLLDSKISAQNNRFSTREVNLKLTRLTPLSFLIMAADLSVHRLTGSVRPAGDIVFITACFSGV